jgi:glycine/D-amino acid oxidase-like deaminating enzyme
MSGFLTTDFKNEPYWWDAARPVPRPTPSLSPGYDAAIVGSGYTGLHAALRLLRAGRSVVVFDSNDPGFGAARRNAGFLGRTFKRSFPELVGKKGLKAAVAIYRELDAAYQTTQAFIETERIDCHATRCGRFVGATSAAHFADLQSSMESMKQHLGFDYRMVKKSEQRSEMATDLYDGGALLPDLGSLHPGLYHMGLLNLVIAAGGIVCGQTEVTKILRISNFPEFEVRTSRGIVKVRDVVVATNGYTSRSSSPWHARRLIPFTGYMAATEILPKELIEKVLPHRRTVIDSNIDIDFFRPAPDTSRILFGGATASGLQDVESIAARLHGILRRALPDLAFAQLSHIWTGQCAGTFDMMPHIGRHDGAWFGMGYNFSGVPMGTYLGMRIGQGILGGDGDPSMFETTKFSTMPLYTGNPWFLPAVMRYFNWHDRRFAEKSSSK